MELDQSPQKDEAFEITDFTAASTWERYPIIFVRGLFSRFISFVEDLFREWNLQDFDKTHDNVQFTTFLPLECLIHFLIVV